MTGLTWGTFYQDSLAGLPIAVEFCMVDLLKEASDHIVRIDAYKRVNLRRWLRKSCGPKRYPKHLWLDLDIPELRDEVERRGGDPDGLLEKDASEMVDRIVRRE